MQIPDEEPMRRLGEQREDLSWSLSSSIQRLCGRRAKAVEMWRLAVMMKVVLLYAEAYWLRVAQLDACELQ